MRRAHDLATSGDLDRQALRAENQLLKARIEQLEGDTAHRAADMVQASLVETLQGFAKGLLEATGDATFKLLACSSAKAIGVDYLLIGERSAPGRIRTLAFVADGQVQEGFEYALEGTPCDQVMERTVCVFPKDVQASFPTDRELVDLGIVGYMGVPLLDAAGKTIGLIAAMHRAPLSNLATTQSMLTIAARAAETELGRKRAEAESRRHAQQLADANERLRHYGEQMEAEVAKQTKELAAEKALMVRIVANVPAAIAFLDRDLDVRWANPACRSFSAVEPAACLGRSVYEVFPAMPHPDPLLEQIVATGGARHVAALPWAGIGYVDLTYVPVYGPDQSLDGILTFILDVTARVDSERLQAAQIERLQELDRLKGDFLNAASHELRTPLTSITGYAEFLEDQIGGPLTPNQAEFVAQIQAGASRLQRIVDDMLDFARLEAGAFSLERQWVDLRARLQAEVASVQPQAREAQLELTTELPPDPVMVCLDPGRIGQVLLNLVGNALKFTPPGGRIRVRLLPGDREVRVEVQDTGIGIASAHRARLFEKFFQVDASSTREHGGAGLGLAIARGLVEAHGGAMGVESQEGQGSTFWFTLPVTPA